MPIYNNFYHSSIRKLVVAFGALFNDIYTKKNDGTLYKVPFIYSSKQKWLQVIRRETTSQIEAITYPRMAYIMKSPSYDASRKLNTMGRITSQTSNNTTGKYNSVFNSIPYNFEFELYVGSKTMDEGLQIIEQILPAFTPSFTVTINELSNPNIERDIKITLSNIDFAEEIDDSLEVESFKLTVWALSFVVQGNIYPPINNISQIKKVIIDLNPSSVTEEGDVSPGYYSNRETTSVNPQSADYDEDWCLDISNATVVWNTPKVFP